MTQCEKCKERLIGHRITLEFCNEICYKNWLLEQTNKLKDCDLIEGSQGFDFWSYLNDDSNWEEEELFEDE